MIIVIVIIVIDDYNCNRRLQLSQCKILTMIRRYWDRTNKKILKQISKWNRNDWYYDWLYNFDDSLFSALFFIGCRTDVQKTFIWCDKWYRYLSFLCSTNLMHCCWIIRGVLHWPPTMPRGVSLSSRNDASALLCRL